MKALSNILASITSSHINLYFQILIHSPFLWPHVVSTLTRTPITIGSAGIQYTDCPITNAQEYFYLYLLSLYPILYGLMAHPV